MLAGNGRHKPAFGSLMTALTTPFGPVGRPTVGLGLQQASIVASGSAPVGDFMELEALRGGVPRYRAIFVLDRFNRYRIVLPSVLGTSGLTVRVFQYGEGASRAAQRSI